MATLRTLEARCKVCFKKASVELLDRRSVVQGTFCWRHGRQQLTALQLQEDRSPSVIIEERPMQEGAPIHQEAVDQCQSN